MALLWSAVRTSASSTSVKHESKKLRFRQANHPFVPDVSTVQMRTKRKNKANMVYTIFPCLFCEIIKTNTITGLRFSAGFPGLCTKQFSNIAI